MLIHIFSSQQPELSNVIIDCKELILESNYDVSYGNMPIELQISDHNVTNKELAKTKIDIALIIINNEDKYDLIKKIKTNSPDCIIAYVCDRYEDIKTQEFTDDYVLKESLQNSRFKTRLKLWIELATLRSQVQHILIKSKNAFGITVWNRRTRFYTQDEYSLELIWEYFLNDKRFEENHYSKNWIQACYSICLKLLTQNIKPTVIFEENDTLFFLTISSLRTRNKEFYESLVEHAQLDKLRLIGHAYKKSKGVFSLHLRKNLLDEFDDIKIHQQIKQSYKKRSAYIPGRNLSLALDMAKDYVKECGIDSSDLAELEALESDIKEDLLQTEQLYKQLQLYGQFFIKYSEAISKLLEFEELKDAIHAIGTTILLAKDNNTCQKAIFFADLI